MFRKLVPGKRALAWTGATFGAVYVYDQTFNNRALSRTARAVYTATLIGLDYKYNFAEGNDIAALHQRNADRLLDLLVRNKGLYIKLGQSMAIQANMLPTPYRLGLSTLFDDAPQDSWEECETTLREELGGRDPSEVFEQIDPNAIASASIAQVHFGKLRSTGEEVAIKIQHRDIRQLAWWDLSTYKALMWVYDKIIFKLPVYFAAKYITDMAYSETDFNLELQNAVKLAEFIASDASYKGKVHVPKVYPEYSSGRVLVMERIDGINLAHNDDIAAAHYDAKSALTLVFDLLTKQTFDWGFVHCDPHPGNWMLRRLPNGKQQLVVLDHGLYVTMSPKLRSEYAQLWRAIFRHDTAAIGEITEEWGFGNPEMFASATMLQNYDNSKTGFEHEKRGAEVFKTFMRDTNRIPLALIFIGRAQRILQGLNRLYGSPVNRIRVLVDGALSTSDVGKISLVKRLGRWLWGRLLVFASDILFSILRIRQWVTKENPEDLFDESLETTAMEMISSD